MEERIITTLESSLKLIIEEGWENRQSLTPDDVSEVSEAVRSVLKDLDEGFLRVASKEEATWVTHDWIKKALLLSFRLHDNILMTYPSAGYDKVPSKFEHWSAKEFEEAGLRIVPGAHVRYSAYLAPGCVMMPSFTNIGVFIGENTMVDIGAQVGSCAQIGAGCHLSAGVVIGGVIEPLQANPVIIEDNCFIGAQSALVEGVLVEEGAVIGMGTQISGSTPIVNRETGAISYGRIPSYSVVVPGVMPPNGSGVSLSCAVIVKQVDEKTRQKTEINDLLRP